jgi:cytochrome c5
LWRQFSWLPDATNREAMPPVHAVFDEGMHTIDIPYRNAVVAPGPHRDIYEKNCSVCHTTRYVSMQPQLPEKKWNDEMTKMIQTFGAQITEPDGKLILEYLVAVKGKK